MVTSGSDDDSEGKLKRPLFPIVRWTLTSPLSAMLAHSSRVWLLIQEAHAIRTQTLRHSHRGEKSMSGAIF